MTFIVICGTDGSGKGTQTRLLHERLSNEGYNVKLTDFPQYGKKSAGLVEEYLNGTFGTAQEVGPYRGSVFYAVDRYAASFEMKEHLKSGGIILSNRYVSANKGHQMAKIRTDKERHSYLTWLNHLEYELFGIPKEDVNILLYVPPEVSQDLATKRAKPEFIGKTKDIHEEDLEHLRSAAEAYQWVAHREGWTVIDCTKDGQLLPIEAIHEIIYHKVKRILES